MKSSSIIAVVIMILAVLWIGSGVFLPSETSADGVNGAVTPASESAKEKEVAVRVREMQAELFTNNIIVTGRTEASREIVLKSEVEGTISEIFVHKGDVTTKGQKLAAISVNNRQALLKEAQERVKQREIEYDAAKKLAEKGFNSQVRLAQAKADLKEARSRLKQARINVNNLQIIAPFDAVVFDREIELGDYVSVGQETFNLVDLNPIHLTAYITESHLRGLKIGAVAQAKLISGRDVSGVVSYIAPRADDQTRTFRIEIDVENEDNSIAAGMTGRIVIPTTQVQAHKISPSILVLDDEGQVGVKIVDDQDIVRFVPVDILQDTIDYMWVSGIADTARIITVGQDFIGIGQKVKVSLSTGDGLL